MKNLGALSKYRCAKCSQSLTKKKLKSLFYILDTMERSKKPTHASVPLKLGLPDGERGGGGESILSVSVKREGHVTSLKAPSGSVRNYGIARSALANLENLRNCVLRTTKTKMWNCVLRTSKTCCAAHLWRGERMKRERRTSELSKPRNCDYNRLFMLSFVR